MPSLKVPHRPNINLGSDLATAYRYSIDRVLPSDSNQMAKRCVFDVSRHSGANETQASVYNTLLHSRYTFIITSAIIPDLQKRYNVKHVSRMMFSMRSLLRKDAIAHCCFFTFSPDDSLSPAVFFPQVQNILMITHSRKQLERILYG